jgi:hypothetical protein
MSLVLFQAIQELSQPANLVAGEAAIFDKMLEQRKHVAAEQAVGQVPSKRLGSPTNGAVAEV